MTERRVYFSVIGSLLLLLGLSIACNVALGAVLAREKSPIALEPCPLPKKLLDDWKARNLRNQAVTP